MRQNFERLTLQIVTESSSPVEDRKDYAKMASTVASREMALPTISTIHDGGE